MKNLNRLLISLPAQGFLWMIFLFILCFFCVHLAKLALLGAEIIRKTPPQAPPEKKEETKEEKKAPAPPQEPVYYIGEKKTRRPKSSYSEPKQIRFK